MASCYMTMTGSAQGFTKVTTYHVAKINMWEHDKKKMQIFICVFNSLSDVLAVVNNTGGATIRDCVKHAVNSDQYDTYFGNYFDAGAAYFPFNHAYTYLKATCKPLTGLSDADKVGFNDCKYDYTGATIVSRDEL